MKIEKPSVRPTRTMQPKWTVSDIPSQDGRIALITGTGGIGYETALALARAGAEVLIAGRNPQKGAAAVERIRGEVPAATVSFEQVDLASLKSVMALASRLRGQLQHLDLLINNAAVMNPPRREETAEGFELQFATNYLGHFALTTLLIPLLNKGREPRVVTLSSIAARQGIINFDDLQAKQSYQPMRSYSQSKLACLMFALELQKRSESGQWGVSSLAAHPGISRTDLLHNAPGRWSGAGMARSFLWFLFQPVAQGALPSLFAATSSDALAGGYYGPSRLGETRGTPADARIPVQALDTKAASRLWEISEGLSNETFPTLENRS